MITRTTLQSIRADVDEALKEVGKKHGVSLKAGSCKYDDSSFTFKLEGVKVSADGKAVDLKVLDFRRFCAMYGMSESDLGKEFVANGKRFRVAGLKPQNTKYPIIADCVSTGRSYKFPADVVRKI